jgi:hypothetical protein
MKEKFKYFEIVKVVSRNIKFTEIYDLEGIVVGKSQNENGKWSYAVSFPNDGWSIAEEYLVSTGKFASRKEVYSGDSVKILVDAHGFGKIK